MNSFKFKKTLAFTVLLTFFCTQIVTPQELQLANQSTLQPVKEPAVTESAQREPAQSVDQFRQTTEQFLQDDFPLSSPTVSNISSPLVGEDQGGGNVPDYPPSLPSPTRGEGVYDFDFYSFEDALDLIRPEFAAAIPIESITKEGLETLRSLDVEVLLVGIRGMKFILTSGDRNEIAAYPEINELLKEASFLAHTHPDETESGGPSAFDLLAATDKIEYLITQDEIYSYNRDGLQEQSLSAEALLRRWEEATSTIRHCERSEAIFEIASGTSCFRNDEQTEARAWANEFIYQMDRLNEEHDRLKIEALRTAGTVAPTTGLTSANLTSFTGSPWLLLMAGSSAQTTLVQQSSSQFQMNYDITQSGSKSSAYISFDNPTTTTVELRDLSTLTEFVIGISGPTGSKVKFEVEDSLGVKSDVTLINVSTTMQYYKISKTLFTGIDWTKIKRFIYSIDSTLTTILTGTLTIQTKTLLYSTTALTSLPNLPYLAPVSGASANTNLVHTGTTGFKINYDITQAGSISGGSIVLDNPGTSTVEVGNLSIQTQFTFGLSGPTGGKVKLEFEDSLGVKSSVILTGLSSVNQYYMVQKTSFTGLDWTRIKRINFIVDSSLGNPLTGTLTVQAKTLTFSTALLTPLPASPRVEILSGATTATKVRQGSNALFSVDFSLAGAGTKSGASISFDNPSTQAIETQNLSSQSQFVFSAFGISNGKIRVEMEDINGGKTSAVVSGLLSSSTQYFVISAQLFSAIDRTKVKRINFFVDSTLISQTTGTFHIGAKTLLYGTSVATTLPGTPSPFIMEGSTSSTYLQEPSSTQARLNYSVSTTGSFSGLSLSFDNLSTSAVETRDLSQGNTLTFGLNTASSSITKVRLEIEDDQGQKASTFLSPLTTGTQYITIQKSVLTGIDWTKIKRMNFVIDKTMITSSTYYASWFQVTLNGFLYTPTVTYNSALTSASVTILPSSPSLFLLPGSSGTTSLTPLTDKFDLRYDLTQSGTISGARVSYDKPSTSTVEIGNLSTLSSIVVGLQAPSNTVRMELVDINGAKSSIFLTNVSSTERFFQVSMSLFTGIDKTKIKWIQFMLDPIVTNHTVKTGDLFVSTKGLVTPSLSAPVVNAVTSPTNQTTQTLSGTKGAGSGIAVNGVMVLAPTDSTTWQADVDLTVEGENIFQIQETNGAGALGPMIEVQIRRSTVPPVVQFTSPATTNNSNYTLTYTSDGVQKSKSYILGKGENKLTFYEANLAGNGDYYSFVVALDSGGFPEPVPPVVSGDSVLTTTTADGLTLKYQNGVLISIANSEGFELVGPEMDVNGNLTGGLLGEKDGTETYFHNGVLVFFTDATGTKHFYKQDGTLDSILSKDGVKTVVSYEKDNLQNTKTILLTTGTGVALYNPAGELLNLFHEDNSKAIFDRGVLSRYIDLSSNVTNFAISTVPEGILARRVEPTVSLPKELLYDVNRTLIRVTQEDGTVIHFTNGLISSVVQPDGTVNNMTFSQDAFGFLTGGQIQFGTNQRTFDASGFLDQVNTEEGFQFKLANDKITTFTDDQGNFYEISKMTQDGKILDGKVTSPNGDRTIYVSGVPVKSILNDGRTLLYREENLRLYLEDLKLPFPEFVRDSSGTSTLKWDGHEVIKRFSDTIEVLTKENWRLIYRLGLLEEVTDPTGLRAKFEVTTNANFFFQDDQGNRYRLTELVIPEEGTSPEATVFYFYQTTGELQKKQVTVMVSGSAKQELFEHSFDASNRLISLYETQMLSARDLKKEIRFENFTYGTGGGVEHTNVIGSIKLGSSSQRDLTFELTWNSLGALTQVNASKSTATPFRTLTLDESSSWSQAQGLPQFSGTSEEVFRQVLSSQTITAAQRFALLYQWFKSQTSVQDPIEIVRLVWSSIARFEEEKLLIETRPLEPGEYDVWGISSARNPEDPTQESFSDYGAPVGSQSGRGGYPNREGVIAPHASFLALNVTPQEAIQNLRLMTQKYTSISEGQYGFYDAFNINTGEVAKVFSAQSIGVSFISAVNLLTGGVLRNELQSDPMMSSALNLLGSDQFSFLTVPQGWETSTAQLTQADRDFLTSFVQKQWQFFNDQVNLSNHFMPPNWARVTDTGVEVAPYSSILDSAFYLVVLMGAAQMGYITKSEARQRAQQTLQVLSSLDTWNGLLHNYYRLDTPSPQAVTPKDKFISTIDNGWLAAAMVMVRNYFAPEYVTVESETATTLPSPFQSLSDSLASGGRYISTLNSGVFLTNPDVNKSFTLTVNAPRAGAYHLWGRVIAPSGGDDSFYVQIDNGPIQLWDTPASSIWTWGQVKDRTTGILKPTLTAGMHTIRIYLREDGTKLDALLLTDNLSFVPSGIPENQATLPMLGTNILETMDFSKLLATERNQFYVGYDPGTNEYTTSHYGLLNTEIRPTILIAIAKGDVPATVWSGTKLTLPENVLDQAQIPQNGSYYTYLRDLNDSTSAVNFVPSWGGSIYEALGPSLFVDEQALSPLGWAKSNLLYTRLHQDFAMGGRADYEARISQLKEEALKRISDEALTNRLVDRSVIGLIPSFLTRDQFAITQNRPLVSFAQGVLNSVSLSGVLSLTFNQGVPTQLTQAGGIRIDNLGFSTAGDLVSGLVVEPAGRTLLYQDGRLIEITNAGAPTESRAVRLIMPEGLVYRLEDTQSGWQDAVLIEAKGVDGSIYTIEDGKIISIERPDGTQVKDIQYDVNSKAVSGRVTDPDGVIRIFKGGKLVRIETPQGFVFEVNDEIVSQLTFPDGRIGRWENIKDPLTGAPLIALVDQNSRVVYKEAGTLHSWIFNTALVTKPETGALLVNTGLGVTKITATDIFGNILGATVTLNDGTVYQYTAPTLISPIAAIFAKGVLSSVTLSNGTVLNFSGNRVIESILPDGTKNRFIYFVNGGVIENIEVETTFTGGSIKREGIVPYLARDYASPELDFLTRRVFLDAVDLSPLMSTFTTDPRTPTDLYAASDPDRGHVLRVDSSTAPNQTAAGLFAKLGAADLRSFRFINVSLRRDSMSSYPTSVTLELKGRVTQSIQIDGITDEWKDFVIPFNPDLSPIYEITVLVNQSSSTQEPIRAYLDNLTLFAVRYDQDPSLKAAFGFTLDELAEIVRTSREVPPLHLTSRIATPLLEERDHLSGDLRMRISFDSQGAVQSYSRGDGGVVQVSDGKATSINLNGTAQVDQIFSDSKLTQSIYRPLVNPEDPVQVIQYEYDRIRRVQRQDTSQDLYTYRYEFDPEGREVTVAKDLVTGDEQYFLDGKMIKTVRPDGLITTFEYDDQGRISRSNAMFQDVETHTFTYTYHGGEMMITDEEGLIRHYDSQGRLTAYTTPGGLTYRYVYQNNDPSNPVLERVELVNYRTKDGTLYNYENGKIVKIVRRDGSVLDQIVLDEDANFVSGRLTDANGVIHSATKGLIDEIILPNGEVKQIRPQHLDTVWLEKSPDGTVGLSGENASGIFKYNENGLLYAFLDRNGVITYYDYIPSEDGTFRTANVTVKQITSVGATRIPTLEEISILADAGKTQVLIGGKELNYGDVGKLLILVIDPLTGEIVDEAEFDVSQPGDATEMNVFLRLIPKDMIILGGVSGASLNFGSDIEEELIDRTFRQFGITGFKTLSEAKGGNWTFIGRQGAEEGAGYQDYAPIGITASVSSHQVIGKSVYAVSDGKLLPTALTLPKGLLSKVSRAVVAEPGLEVFATAPNGDAALWKKNFNPAYGDTGFLRLFPEVSRFPKPGTSLQDEEMRAITRQILSLLPRHEKIAVYFDDRYVSSWIHHEQARHLKSRLVELGIIPLDAEGLRLWLEREGPNAAVIMAQDVLPDAAFFDDIYVESQNLILLSEQEIQEETLRVGALIEPLNQEKQSLEVRNVEINNRIAEIDALLVSDPNNTTLQAERSALSNELQVNVTRVAAINTEVQNLQSGLSAYVNTRQSTIISARAAMDQNKVEVFSRSASEHLVRKYLNRGGSMVWMNDTPFYWIGEPNGSRYQASFPGGMMGQDFLLEVREGWQGTLVNAVDVTPIPNAGVEVRGFMPTEASIINPWPESISVDKVDWHLSSGTNHATNMSANVQAQEWNVGYDFDATGNAQSAKIEVDFFQDLDFASGKLFDLRRQTLSLNVKVPTELAGKPVQVRFFSRDGSFRTQLGPAFDLNAAEAGQFVEIKYRPDFAFACSQAASFEESVLCGRTAPGFDPTQIRFLGVEFLTDGSFAATGEVAIKSLRVEGVSEEVRHLYTDEEFQALGVFQPQFQINIPWDEVSLWYQAMLDVFDGQLPEELVMVSDVDSAGQVTSEKEAGGRLLRYEAGRIKEIVDSEGFVEKRYHYDQAGNLTGIEDFVTRQQLDREIAKAQQNLFDRELVMIDLLEEQKGIIEERITRTVSEQRSILESKRSELQNMSRPKKCKGKCKKKFNNAINDGIQQVNGAINQLAAEEARALGTLNEEVGNARDQVSASTKQAILDFEAKEIELRKQNLKQEITPVLAEQYRKFFGRDPSVAEIGQWVDATWPNTAIDMELLTRSLSQSPEHAAKIDRKNRLIGEIAGWIEVYLQRLNDPTQMDAHLASLGLTRADVQFNGQYRVNETSWPAILRWLEAQDLHFGDSAYRTLQAYLAAQGIMIDEVQLAHHVLLVDILTGVINVLNEGAVQVSLFSLDHAAKFFGVQSFIQKLPSLESLARLLTESGKPVLVHINGDHYVLVESIDGENVTYRDMSIGQNGEAIKVTRDAFLEVWQGVALAQQMDLEASVIPTQDAKQIKGAFFWFIAIIIGIIKAVVAAIAAVIAAVTAVISAVASVISAAIGAIQAAIASLNIGSALSALGSGLKTLGAGILHGLKFVGGKLLAGVKFVGTKLFDGIQFLKNGLFKGFEFVKSGFLKGFEFVKTTATRIFAGIKDGIVNGFNFLKQGIFRGLDFLPTPQPTDPIGTGSGKAFIKKHLVGSVIRLAAKEGLKAFGVDNTTADLISSFLTGGITGGAGAPDVGNFFKTTLAKLAFQGVSELGRHLDLPPPITSALSIVASTVTGAALDPAITIPQSLKNLAPKLLSDLAFSGVIALGNKIGLDPRISSLIGVPVRAGVKGLLDSLINPNGGGGPGRIFQAIKDGFKAAAKSIGFDFGGRSSDPLFGSLGSGSILKSIESALGKEGLWSSVFSLVGKALLNPFNLIGGVIKTIFTGITDFGSLIQQKGIIGALESVATSVFSPKTIEKIREFGGMAGLFATVPKVLTTLITGEQAQELQIDQTTSIFFDLLGNFIGKKEDGVTQIGTFGIDSFGKWALLAGKVFATILGDLIFEGTAEAGQLGRIILSGPNGVIIEGNPQGTGPVVLCGPEQNCPIDIPGPGPEPPTGGSFWNFILRLAAYGLKFFIENGFLGKAEVITQPGSSGSGATGRTSELYVLTNGILNDNPSGPPTSTQHLEVDLINQSNGEITDEDVTATPVFLPRLGIAGDAVKDIVSWTFESMTLPGRLWLVGEITSHLVGYFQQNPLDIGRKLLGVAKSGGFAPLLETIAKMRYNAGPMVGVAAATTNLAKLSRDMIGLVGDIASLLMRGVITGVDTLFERLLSKIPVLGPIFSEVSNIIGGVLGFLRGLIPIGINPIEKAFGALEKVMGVLLRGADLTLSDMSLRGATHAVNLYGSIDILKLLHIGGYRDELAGFTAAPLSPKPLFNIEIRGAQHSDYYRLAPVHNPVPITWNDKVSDFVTRLLIVSDDPNRLRSFLQTPPPGLQTIIREENNRWIVEINGWQEQCDLYQGILQDFC